MQHQKCWQHKSSAEHIHSNSIYVFHNNVFKHFLLFQDFPCYIFSLSFLETSHNIFAPFFSSPTVILFIFCYPFLPLSWTLGHKICTGTAKNSVNKILFPFFFFFYFFVAFHPFFSTGTQTFFPPSQDGHFFPPGLNVKYRPLRGGGGWRGSGGGEGGQGWEDEPSGRHPAADHHPRHQWPEHPCQGQQYTPLLSRQKSQQGTDINTCTKG